jgi:biotin carboxyl carrier protein
MIKKLRVTVDGRSYDVVVETSDETAPAPLPVAAPVQPAAPVAPAPVAAAPLAAPVARPSAGANDVPSPLAGRVVAVVAQPGQVVKEGENLLTLEAMKMNTLINAPRDGKVKTVKVAVGDAVEEGQALVTLE